MTLADLERLIESHAPGSLIPRDWLLAIVHGLDVAGEQDALADMSVSDAAEVLGRSTSTVREYCRRKLLPGSYRQQGREWRIPRSAIRAFQSAQASPPPEQRAQRRAASTVDIGAWRKELEEGVA